MLFWIGFACGAGSIVVLLVSSVLWGLAQVRSRDDEPYHF